ncbi:TetR/AcrR family transcriptional regulator [Microbacterium betulae]|uniref:TetR/AcrR family transcriptional regulator n=1 Tax=Microbacterium betulae TaxID=2981139 RepID=A0AA97I7X4_9MICO|nr:TetR/AcrR family transcriptional regulator [Microbacterium sp. AB]WOF23925.1 TetR/AcrR family transcriptional regulator [Microbacterium sp. AB]
MPAAVDTRRSILDAAQRTVAHKGWAAVGLNEVLGVAGVPKGSFYHWFGSKDAFGVAMLQSYFTGYLADMDDIFARTDRTVATRLVEYWRGWRETQSVNDCEGRCLAVKLGAEVADLSEPMRHALEEGTGAIIDRLAAMLDAGAVDGSLPAFADVRAVARSLYGLWVGASVLAKIHRDVTPMDDALAHTLQLLRLA